MIFEVWANENRDVLQYVSDTVIRNLKECTIPSRPFTVNEQLLEERIIGYIWSHCHLRSKSIPPDIFSPKSCQLSTHQS
jgi:hypothetical protein